MVSEISAVLCVCARKVKGHYWFMRQTRKARITVWVASLALLSSEGARLADNVVMTRLTQPIIHSQVNTAYSQSAFSMRIHTQKNVSGLLVSITDTETCFLTAYNILNNT